MKKINKDLLPKHLVTIGDYPVPSYNNESVLVQSSMRTLHLPIRRFYVEIGEFFYILGDRDKDRVIYRR